MYHDIFAFHINNDQVYDPENLYPGVVEGLYNGNISETYWLSSTDNTIRKYGYRYDKLNRLQDAYFQQPYSLDYNCQSYNEHLSYDKNGNILTLNRHSRLENFLAAVEIDDLEYFYQGNQLTKVTDLSGYPQGFEDDSDGTNDDEDDYRYDSFGNMYRDDNKQIVFISYNHLNLPVEIEFQNGSTISYLYNAAGQKLRKIVSDIATSGVSTTEYLDGFQYNNAVLQFFSHPEGYVLNTPDRNGDPSYDYVYQYKDHLGNIRMNFVFDPGDGSSSLPQLKILEENHYYPFGLKHENYNVTKKKMKWESELIGGEEMELKRVRQVPNSGYQYKYNGKEWQDELGLNVYAYGWRDYDPTIGRFIKIDRFAEKYQEKTPYNYAANNPIYYIDVAGDSLYVKHNKGFLGLGGKETLRYENGNLYNRDGSAYTGRVKGFLRKTVEALGEIGNSQEGLSVINELENSSNNFTIVKSNTNSFTPDNNRDSFANIPEVGAAVPGIQNSSGSGGTIGFNPNSTNGGFNTAGSRDRPAFIALGHEMFHGRDSNQGVLYPKNNFNSYQSTHQGLLKSEWRAVYYENILRTQSGVPLRTNYGVQQTSNGPQPTGPRLLDQNNNPINYNVQ